MKKVFLIFLLIWLPALISAQNQMVEYEYWFDKDYKKAIRTAANGQPVFTLLNDVSTQHLTTGLHSICLRFKDSKHLWSGTISQMFYKLDPQHYVENRMVRFEYWLDKDSENKKSIQIQNGKTVTLEESLETASISDGLHLLNFRLLDQRGLWTSVHSHFFYKLPDHLHQGENFVTQFQYWFNDDVAEAKTISVTQNKVFSLDEKIQANHLPMGLHALRYRFKDRYGNWSVSQSQYFYKTRVADLFDNQIMAYRYWINEEEPVLHQLAEPITPFEWITEIDMKAYPAGEYQLSFQFQDTRGKWSTVQVEHFIKNPLPLADFEVNHMQICEGDAAVFDNQSVDADVFVWDFGDGTQSDEISPIHYYSNPGVYNVKLTASHSDNPLQSIKQMEISVHGTHRDTLHQYICPGEVFEWQQYSLTSNGWYYDSLKSVTQCDSIRVLHLQLFDEAPVPVIEILGGAIVSNLQGKHLWFYNDEILTNQTAHQIQNPMPGKYFVRFVTNDECTSPASNTLVFAITGLGNFIAGSDINIYPNPANNKVYITVRGGDYSLYKLELRMLQGSILQSTEFSEETSIDVSLLPPAVYLIHISGNQKNGVFRLVKY
ncbi:MAG: T9SS type A sorting domain-containing protein [Cyclobacteriaceae bacterium]|nr:T9SS type A sorting domain-containing protein [Cyclobacteriaceae bacterium]